MRKLFFALSLVGMLMTQSLSYATTFLNSTIQETEQQEEAVEEESMVEEAPAMDEPEAVEEEVEAPAEVSFTQELKKRFIEGGPGFMGIVLICLILGLAIAIERIIYLNLATTNSQKLTAGVEEALFWRSRGSQRALQKHQRACGFYLLSGSRPCQRRC